MYGSRISIYCFRVRDGFGPTDHNRPKVIFQDARKHIDWIFPSKFEVQDEETHIRHILSGPVRAGSLPHSRSGFTQKVALRLVDVRQDYVRRCCYKPVLFSVVSRRFFRVTSICWLILRLVGPVEIIFPVAYLR